jgi:hypothetical protein
MRGMRRGRPIGLRTLNAGISSYATAREIALLDPLDTSRLKCLVIQYARNDLEENASFFLSADRQIPSSPERFQEEQARFGRARSYFLESTLRHSSGRARSSTLTHRGRWAKFRLKNQSAGSF